MRSCFGLAFTIFLIGSAHGSVRDAALNEQETKSDGIDKEDSYGTQLNQFTDVDPQHYSVENMLWATGDSINIPVGPENAVYCTIQTPNGHTLFDNFGQCRIVLDRVTVDHGGIWVMRVASAGVVELQTYTFSVDVQARDNMPIVTTTVLKNRPSVTLTCSVPSSHVVRACKFRDHLGNILVASHGDEQNVSEVVNYETKVDSHQCMLHLLNPTVSNLGIWRCAVDTSTGTYYGFLTVVCPHLMLNPAVAASVVTEPVLQDRSLSFVEGEAVTFSCAANTALRYCYFRARNGTTFSVFPRMSPHDNFEYVGAGLDAGECGIKFNRFAASEASGWSCHVGLLDTTAPELRTAIEATVTERMSVRHYFASGWLLVEMQVYYENPLSYCRFVRMNGEGFTSDNAPTGFLVTSELERGRCTLFIEDPNILNLHPWTVAAKIRGEEGEISMTTTENLLIIPSPPYVPPVYSRGFNWLFIIPLVLIPLGMAALCIRKKNRTWVQRKASWVSQSFRSSATIVKKPPTDHQDEEKGTKVNSVPAV